MTHDKATEALRAIGERWARRAYELLPAGPERDEAERDALELTYSSSLRASIFDPGMALMRAGFSGWSGLRFEHTADGWYIRATERERMVRDLEWLILDGGERGPVIPWDVLRDYLLEQGAFHPVAQHMQETERQHLDGER